MLFNFSMSYLPGTLFSPHFHHWIYFSLDQSEGLRPTFPLAWLKIIIQSQSFILVCGVWLICILTYSQLDPLPCQKTDTRTYAHTCCDPIISLVTSYPQMALKSLIIATKSFGTVGRGEKEGGKRRQKQRKEKGSRSSWCNEEKWTQYVCAFARQLWGLNLCKLEEYGDEYIWNHKIERFSDNIPRKNIQKDRTRDKRETAATDCIEKDRTLAVRHDYILVT